ncbi:MAG: hypothetical protein ACI4D7_01695 [Lachnospiraceae bacterium]
MELLRTWYKEEREKISAMNRNEIIRYIWDYYRLHLTAIISLCLILAWIGYNYVTTPGENWFYACFANTYGDVGNHSDFYDDFAEYADLDLKEKNLVFDNACYFDPTKNSMGNSYYETLITYIESGTLDVLLMEKEQLQAFGATGRLLDLESPETAELFHSYSDRLVYCSPSDGKSEKAQVAIGIDLSGCCLTGEGKPYPDGVVLGIGAWSEHLDMAEIFLQYLFEEEHI